MDPLPPINKVFSLVIQHERQGNSSELDDSKILVNAAKNGKFASSSKPSTRSCSYCGKDNHVVENCFKKNGVPPHMKKSSSAHSAAVEGGNHDSNAATPPSISQEQYDKLMSLLQHSNLAPNSVSASSNQVGSSMNIDHTSVIHKGINLSSHNACVLSTWIIDSGASHHICNSLNWFQSYIEIKPISIKLPNGNSAIAKYTGTVNFSPTFAITDVLCVPNFSINLLAVSKLCSSSNYIVNFYGTHCEIQDKKCLKMIGSADEHDGLYHLNLTDKVAHVASIDGSNHTSIPKSALWHFRLGHPSHSRLVSLRNKFPYVTDDHNGICDICHFARFTWITLMKSKAETRQHVINLVKMIQTQHSHQVKIIRSDNGPEFSMNEFFSSNGILHQTSCVESPQQNGRVERKHQHILNIARALLYQSNLPKHFWSYAVLHATFIINRITTPVLHNKSPYEMLHNDLPNLHDLKVFGSLAYASTLTIHRTKLSPRGRKCVFLGYKHGVKGTVLYDLESKEIFISRNVTHFDHILPYTTDKTQFHWHYHTSIDCDSPTSHSPSPDTTSPLQPSPSPSTDTNQTDTLATNMPIITDIPPAISPNEPHSNATAGQYSLPFTRERQVTLGHCPTFDQSYVLQLATCPSL
ncbi:unnamed protein product [Trifolium pratense]|uniref:Uncharacterized protein n=1 Tax=Trifolium pratense TaxID=57577 RepID=A0ACB0JCQ8_TRIPR|nr:unnamed protein product [Trifolium pratense]